MKVLLDACVWGGAKKVLAEAGHDVIHAGDWSNDPGDDEILTRAHQEGRVLVTLDKDFGELIFLRRRGARGSGPPRGLSCHRAGRCLSDLDGSVPGRVVLGGIAHGGADAGADSTALARHAVIASQHAAGCACSSMCGASNHCTAARGCAAASFAIGLGLMR